MRSRVVLRGCTIEPMAGYLKALAVLRLISEQADPTARGWWEGNAFCLESKFDEKGLVSFFLEDYCPTPIVAPWNGGSGFSEGDRRDGIDAILGSNSPRLAEYGRTIKEIFSWRELGAGERTLDQILREVRGAATNSRPGKAQNELLKLITDLENAAATNGIEIQALLSLSTKEIETAAKPVYKSLKKLLTAAKKNRRTEGKEEIVRACRNRLGDSSVDWIDSAVVLRTTTKLMYPPLLGTGGSEGRLDYTNCFMERVAELLLSGKAAANSLLGNALFAESTNELAIGAVGQLDPGRAGGYNQGPGIATSCPINHWDFVFAMEGAVAWASGAARRQGIATHGVSCSPFTVRSRAVGYGSAEEKDQASARAEIWMPVWERPSRFEEVRTLLREGRVEWGGKPVEDAMQFAEAAVSLGTQRGISAFQRYSMIMRRGQSYLALPLGRFPVRERIDADLLEELDRVLARIDRFARGFKSEVPPPQFSSRRRQIDGSIYEFALRGGEDRLQNVLVAIGRMEQYFAQRDLKLEPKLDSPLGGLSTRWLLAANDGSLNFRLAVSLASILRSGNVGSIRANLAPIHPNEPWKWVTGAGQTAWKGNGLAQRMVCALKRRLMDGERLNCESLPLWGAVRLDPGDVASFLANDGIDESRIEDLLFGLTLVEWHDKEALDKVKPELYSSWHSMPPQLIIPRDYAVLKHLFHSGLEIRPEPAILSLLGGSRIGDACEIAMRRLRVSGRAPLNARFSDSADGIRLAASLLIPIKVTSIEALSRLVLHEQEHKVAAQTKGR